MLGVGRMLLCTLVIFGLCIFWTIIVHVYALEFACNTVYIKVFYFVVLALALGLVVLPKGYYRFQWMNVVCL